MDCSTKLRDQKPIENVFPRLTFGQKVKSAYITPLLDIGVSLGNKIGLLYHAPDGLV